MYWNDITDITIFVDKIYCEANHVFCILERNGFRQGMQFIDRMPWYNQHIGEQNWYVPLSRLGPTFPY